MPPKRKSNAAKKQAKKQPIPKIFYPQPPFPGDSELVKPPP